MHATDSPYGSRTAWFSRAESPRHFPMRMEHPCNKHACRVRVTAGKRATDSRAIWVVDRVEEDSVILVEDETGRTVAVDRNLITVPVREGTVLGVPQVTGGGEPAGPDWRSAVREEELRRRRLAEARQILDELRTRDPEGDVVF